MAATTKQNRKIVWAFTVFMLLIGLAMAGFGVYFVGEASRAKTWPSVSGTITNVAVRSSRSSQNSSRSFHFELTYRYQVGGIFYTSNRYRLGDGPNAGKASSSGASSKWSNGDSVDVYYDPNSPDSAVLVSKPSWGVYVPGVLGLFFAGSGALLLVGLLRGPADASA
jgi:hypothetical protein